MGGYVFGVVLSAVAAFLMISLSPDGERGEMGKYIAFLGSLAVMLSIILPLPAVVKEKSLDIVPEIGGEIREGPAEKTGKYHATLATQALFQIYGEDKAGVIARVYGNENGDIEKIELLVPEGAEYSLQEAGEVISRICGIETAVKERRESDGLKRKAEP